MLRLAATTALALCLPAALLAQEFPLTVETTFGPVTIQTQPERVATVDYAGADNVLALGFQPLTARKWFGPYDNALWPWAQALASQDPVVLGDPLDFEAIAATGPDVILALRSGITAEDFAKLNAIAPTVAVPPGRGDYDLTWREQAERAGLALGKAEETAARIATIESSIAAIAAAHPDWQGKTFAMMTYWDGSVGLYSATDSSVAFVQSLGLTVHPKVVELSKPGEFYITLSQEVLPELDADIIFWYAAADDQNVQSLAARKGMRAVAEGREVFLSLESLTNGAMSHGSLLSVPEAAQRLVPMIEAALDGNPATIVSEPE